MIERRSFLTGLIAIVAAPAIVRAGSLMPVKQMIDPLATVDAANQIGSQIVINGLGGTLRVGDIITFEGVEAFSRIFPERQQGLRQFVVTAEARNGDRIINIYPPIAPKGLDPRYATTMDTPRNRAELKLVEYRPLA